MFVLPELIFTYSVTVCTANSSKNINSRVIDYSNTPTNGCFKEISENFTADVHSDRITFRGTDKTNTYLLKNPVYDTRLGTIQYQLVSCK